MVKTRGNSTLTTPDDVPTLERLPAGERRVLILPFRTLSEAEEARLLEWCRDSRRTDLHALVLLLVDTGATLAEVLKLEWEDVSTALRVRRGKIKPQRMIPLTERLSEFLASWRGKAAWYERVFPYVTRKVAGGWWSEARSALGLDADAKFTLDCLRDTFCVRRIQCGEHPAKVEELTGVPPGRLRRIVNASFFDEKGGSGATPGTNTARKLPSGIAQAGAKRRDAERATKRASEVPTTPRQLSSDSPPETAGASAEHELLAVLTAWLRLPADVRSGIASFVRVLSETQRKA